MTHRAWFIAILPALLVTLVVFAATAQRVEPLVLADLRVSGVAVDDDSASVRRRLDTPVRVDANVLHYPDLDVVLKDGSGWAWQPRPPRAFIAHAMLTLRSFRSAITPRDSTSGCCSLS